MKQLRFLSMAFIALAMGLGFNACSDDDPTTTEGDEAVSIALSSSSASATRQGGKFTVNVTSNATWTATASADWITLSTTHGVGNASFDVTVAENTTFEQRTGTVTVSYGGTKTSTPQQFTVTQAAKPTFHFDLLISVGATTGMSSVGVTAKLIRSVDLEDLTNPDYTISFKGQGADITSTMDCESLIKGAYYYEAAPLSNTNFAKFSVDNTGVTTVARVPFGSYTIQSRKYAHAWTSDNEIVFIGSDKASSKGSKNNVIWARVKDNGSTLALAGEGKLDLATATASFKTGGVVSYSTSGLAEYRKSDNTIIYAFTDKATDAPAGFYVAFIDATTMEVKKVVNETRVDEMGGTAFGELQQEKLFLDDNQDLYISCGTAMADAKKSTQQNGSLVRIKNGTTEMDQTYFANKMPNGNLFSKILSVKYVGNGKCVLYIQDPVKAGLVANLTDTANDAWGQSAFNSFYYLYDLTTGSCDEIKYNNASLAPSCGTFTDRVTVYDGNIYIGTSCDEKTADSRIYVYNLSTGKVTMGAKIESGYYFDRLSVVDYVK